MSASSLCGVETANETWLWGEFSSSILMHLNENFRRAQPFPHISIDGLFSADFLASILEEAHVLPQTSWDPHYTALQKKRQLNRWDAMPPALLSYFTAVKSPDFIQFLEKLTGIAGLQPDIELFGGGLHEASQNGHFQIHVDFQKHPRTQKRNTLAVITYLNPDWQEEDEGSLELWNSSTERPEAFIAPIFGRTLVMEQSPTALHGYPEPVKKGCRRALIAYFYTDNTDSDPLFEVETTRYLRRSDIPMERRAQMFLREQLPQPMVTGMRKACSRLLHYLKDK
ncbi:hypothetical protein AA0472_2824 [Acetobacter estunensis NRIC 0472]|uniref:2OG-Fe(II) oxygenase n=1 Tax=Acetobacter estunensis TaxID=104097 RepID=A0A967B6X1_9PROT|nr:2OG-Fe(II) oxygenase [Acetobacter estunensis]NHO53509.1 2OG-Fe(II) oxygenase [Acetobacter estunensis]GBQ28861.1 hypothetical protein AA0472_2824 [Acetobacter estunensis NRIC 0472]